MAKQVKASGRNTLNFIFGCRKTKPEKTDTNQLKDKILSYKYNINTKQVTASFLI